MRDILCENDIDKIKPVATAMVAPASIATAAQIDHEGLHRKQYINLFSRFCRVVSNKKTFHATSRHL